MIQVTVNGEKVTVRINADLKGAFLDSVAIVKALYRNLHDEEPLVANLFKLFVTTETGCWSLRPESETVTIDFTKLKPDDGKK